MEDIKIPLKKGSLNEVSDQVYLSTVNFVMGDDSFHVIIYVVIDITWCKADLFILSSVWLMITAFFVLGLYIII